MHMFLYINIILIIYTAYKINKFNLYYNAKEYYIKLYKILSFISHLNLNKLSIEIINDLIKKKKNTVYVIHTQVCIFIIIEYYII